MVDSLPKKTRRKTFDKKELIRKPISVVKKLESYSDLNETEKEYALFEIQKKFKFCKMKRKSY